MSGILILRQIVVSCNLLFVYIHSALLFHYKYRDRRSIFLIEVMMFFPFLFQWVFGLWRIVISDKFFDFFNVSYKLHFIGIYQMLVCFTDKQQPSNGDIRLRLDSNCCWYERWKRAFFHRTWSFTSFRASF